MLHVQEYLEHHTFDELTEELGIKLTHHEYLPLVILNYHQIDSPKRHPVVRECRGLVLHTETHEVVARAFDRFFNWGEVPEEDEQFDFSDFTCTSKEDGSLILIYYFDGQWRVNTRGTFGDGLIPHQEFTWAEAVDKALGLLGGGLAALDRDAIPGRTYVCELCSPWNKVVRRYGEPVLYLLAVIMGEREVAYPHHVDDTAVAFGMWRLGTHSFTGIEAIQEYLKERSESDPTFEGVVARDKHGRRFKVKSATYFALHQIFSQLNGDEEINPKHLLPFVLSGDDNELLTYFPEAREAYYALKAWVLEQYAKTLELWAEHRHIEGQKEFALKVKDNPFSGVLFSARRRHEAAGTVEAFRQEWRGSDRLILKRLAEK